MEFFNDLSKRFSSVARSVSEKTKDSVESTRLAGDLRAQKNAVEQMYTELGRLCYQIRIGKGDADQAEQVFDNIQRALERIEELTAQRDALRDVRRCPACGGVMPREARFCSACGRRLPEDAPETDTDGPADVEYCPACGAQRNGDEKYCALCGKPFDAPAAPEAPAPKEEVEVVAVNAEEPDGENLEE